MKYQIQNLEAPKPKMRKIVFDDLFCSDIFQALGSIDYELYMRIQSIYSEMDNLSYNAVSLVSGKLTHFDDEDEVELYDGSVTFNEKLFKSYTEVE